MAVRKREESSRDRRAASEVYAQRYSVRPPQARTMSAEESRKLLDEKSRAYFKVSGEEFADLYRAGVYNLDHPKVAKLGLLVSLLTGE